MHARQRRIGPSSSARRTSPRRGVGSSVPRISGFGERRGLAAPAPISDSHVYLDCIGALLAGQTPAVAMQATQDESLRSLLASVTATESLYEKDRAQFAAHQVLAKLELPRIEQRLAELHRTISGHSQIGSPEWMDLVRKRLELQGLQKDLRKVLQGEQPRG